MAAYESNAEMIAEYDERFARRLKDVRTRRGLTAQQLADMTGIPRVAISKIENGDRGVQVGEAVAIVDALDIHNVDRLCKAAPVRLQFEMIVD
jgi:transcriptional regulator with XRE-family HTH domain